MSPHLTFCNLTDERAYPVLLEFNHSSRQANNVPAPIPIEVIANVLANINHRTIRVRRGCFLGEVAVVVDTHGGCEAGFKCTSTVWCPHGGTIR